MSINTQWIWSFLATISLISKTTPSGMQLILFRCTLHMPSHVECNFVHRRRKIYVTMDRTQIRRHHRLHVLTTQAERARGTHSPEKWTNTSTYFVNVNGSACCPMYYGIFAIDWFYWHFLAGEYTPTDIWLLQIIYIYIYICSRWPHFFPQLLPSLPNIPKHTECVKSNVEMWCAQCKTTSLTVQI